MKLHSPTAEPVQIALTSGHTSVVTAEGVDLPQMFHMEAIARGCLPEGVSRDQTEEAKSFERKKHIAAAMEAMADGNSPEDFTKDGKPDLNRLSARVGFKVTRSEADFIWEEITKD